MEELLKENPEIQKRLQTFLEIGRDLDGARRPSNRQIRVATEIAMGSSPTEALRSAEYSPSVINKPCVVLNSRGLAEALETITKGKDDYLAGKLATLMDKSARVDTLNLPYYPTRRKNEDEESYKERCKGIITDKEVTKLLEEVGGVVKRIFNNMSGRTVYYLFPDATVQLKAVELIAKIKGSIAPAKTENKNLNYNFSPAMLRKEMEKRRQNIINITEKQNA